MSVRSTLGTPVVAVVFLLLSIWPTSVVVSALPSGLELLGIPVACALVLGFVHVHERENGTLGDAGAYLFWVYAVAILLAFVDQLVYAASGVAFITESASVPLANAAFVLVVYVTAWWLVYHDGWARIRPLNWGEDRTDAASEE